MLATGALVATLTAGCSALSRESPTLDLVLYNHVDTAYTVEMGLFRVEDGLSRSEARAYQRSIDLDPRGEVRLSDVADSRQYLVEYEVYENNDRRTDGGHVHYYPVDDDDGDRLTFDLRPPGTLTRRQ